MMTEPPCTSWSYWRMIQCLLAMEGWERREEREAAMEEGEEDGEEEFEI